MPSFALTCTVLALALLGVALLIIALAVVCLCRGEARHHRAQEQRRLNAILEKIREEREHDQTLPPAA